MTDQNSPQQYQVVSQPKDSAMAIVSLVCGIASYFIIPFIGSIAAIIFGHIAKNEIKKSAGMIKGNGMATWGLILGYVQIGLLVLGICVLTIVLITSGAAISDVFSNINTSLY